MVKLANRMIEIVEKVGKAINYDGLHMRMGLHTGDIVGGVIGTDIVRFDIYGPDVLIANKMESNGVNDKLCVSEYTKNLLESLPDFPFQFKYHKEVDVKTYGITMPSYLLEDILVDEEESLDV